MPDSHSDRDHAEFSPSALKYIAGCGGFQGRSGTNAAAEKGTRIHEALEIGDPSNLESEEEVSIFHEIVAEEESFLQNFINCSDVTGLKVKQDFKEIQLTVELDGTSTWGTCDRLVVFNNDTGVLIDYKTGISVIDTPEKNQQARAYTVGAFQKYKDLNKIVFVFFIPVRNETLFHTFYREDVPAIVSELSSIIKQGEIIRPKWDDGAPSIEELTPTVHCRYCKHEDKCPALGGLVIEVAKKVNPQLPDVDLEETEDPEIVEQLWVIAKIVSNWSDRLKKRAVAMAQEGVEFPSLRLKNMGVTKRVTDNKTLVSIAETYGLELDDVLNIASIPLAKLAKEAGQSAEKGSKKKISEEFIDACNEAGILIKSNPRFTLS